MKTLYYKLINLKDKIWYGWVRNRHHIIKTKHKITPWIDTDERMLWGIMECVRFYVEEDSDSVNLGTEEELRNDEYFKSASEVEQKHMLHQARVEAEIRDINNYFQKYYIPMYNRNIADIDDDVDAKATKIAMRAVELRGAMWS